ncbi:MAG TPA: energy transducer TonB [Vicinamibacterales bacterium]|nr:energy transducer TonB [Vicinamibacterales bacterium]
MIDSQELPHVFSAAEIARAAGVQPRDVQDLAAAGLIQPIGRRYFSSTDAVNAVRALKGHAVVVERPLFRPAGGVRREPGLPIALSGTLHAALVAGFVLVTSVGMARTQALVTDDDKNEMRLVFLVEPGPGGGGGGGGLKQPAPPPPAERKGLEKMRSPVPPRRPPPPVDPPVVERPVEPPPIKVEPVAAPVVPVAADPRDRAGVPWTPREAPPQESDSQGPGAGGGTGSGQGTGIGEGNGAGIGPGSGGGTGGGPYRPGTGITPPAIVREVKPDYTEEGRRRHIEGDVVLEIVVRSDGNVGSVKLVQGLGAGLDQRAIDAVRQWRFSPAKRYGVPVDVIVEVAMEFKLR